MVFGHLHRVAVGQRYPEYWPHPGFPYVHDSRVVDLTGRLIAMAQQPARQRVLQVHLGHVRFSSEVMPRRPSDPELWLTRVLRGTLRRLEESLADAVAQGFLTAMNDLRQFRDRVPARSIYKLDVGRLLLRDRVGRAFVPLAMEPFKGYGAPGSTTALQTVGKVEPELGIAGETGSPMPDPLTSHEDRELDVQFDLTHLERRRVAMPHEVVDEPGVLADLLGPGAVRHARRLHDRGVVAHVVDDPDEPVIEDRDRLVEKRLHRRHGRPTGLVRGLPLGLDLGLLRLRDGRGPFEGVHRQRV